MSNVVSHAERAILGSVSLVILLVAVYSSSSSAASNSTTSTNGSVTYNSACERTAISQIALDDCLASELTQLDVQLSASLAKESHVFGAELALAAQSQWKKFVSANCKMYANPNKGGTIYPFLLEKCQRNLTVTRIEEIKQDTASQPQ